jgi:hypothetical protein
MIIADVRAVVKHFFKNFYSLLLDDYSLFISGKNFVHFDEQKMLDKIAGVWYNGNTLRGGWKTARRMNKDSFLMDIYVLNFYSL